MTTNLRQLTKMARRSDRLSRRRVDRDARLYHDYENALIADRLNNPKVKWETWLDGCKCRGDGCIRTVERGGPFGMVAVIADFDAETHGHEFVPEGGYRWTAEEIVRLHNAGLPT